MQSIEEQIAEQVEHLQKHGAYNLSLVEGCTTAEARLGKLIAEGKKYGTVKPIRESVRKHNGAGDNGRLPLAESVNEVQDSETEALNATCKLLGLSEAETTILIQKSDPIFQQTGLTMRQILEGSK